MGHGKLLQDHSPSPLLFNALPVQPVFLVPGLSNLSLPFKGGLLVPQPDLILGGLISDTTGRLFVASSWLAGISAGLPVCRSPLSGGYRIPADLPGSRRPMAP